MHPAEEKSPDRAEAAAQIGVFSAGLWNHGAQFGIGEGAEKGKNCADDPRREDYGNEAAFTGHFGGLEKDSRADHGAYDDRAGRPGAESADEIEPLRG